jgi:hypothetical protein
MSDGERVDAFGRRWLDTPGMTAVGPRNDLLETLAEVRLDERRKVAAWILLRTGRPDLTDQLADEAFWTKPEREARS